MGSASIGRVLLLFFAVGVRGYEVPDVKIELLHPRGFTAAIPDVAGISLFVFQGHVNRNISLGLVGSLKGEILKPQNGWWRYTNGELILNVGDVINYYIVIVMGGQRYSKDKLRYEVMAPTIKPDSRTPLACNPSVTKVRGLVTQPCSGQVVFEDTFDLNIDENKWQIQQYIPVSDYGYPFVSYQKLAVSISDGKLEITPSLQKDQLGYNFQKVNSGTLDLYKGCTGPENACFMQGEGWDILPPVISGKISTKEFAFTYGVAEVRAKMPIGDWLYSEIHLESVGGSNKMPKIMKIASTRGNEILSDGCGNKLLYGGLIVSPKCRNTLLSMKNGTTNWGDEYHVYSVEWRPEKIVLYVDGEEWGRVDGRIRDRLGPDCDVPAGLLAGEAALAPFDTHYFLSLGVAAGGVTEFTDDVITSAGNRKPWKNREAKGKLKFWKHQNRWHQTWKAPSMNIDYVKVTAL